MDLTSFQHSLFLSALGDAILNSLWQGFLLWIIYETIIISYKKTNAKFKYNLSVLFIFCSFIWFICTFILKLQVSQNISYYVSGVNNLETLDKSKSSFFYFFLSFTSNILPYLSVAYIILLFFLMAKLLAAWRNVHFIVNKNLIIPPEHLETFASKVASQIGIPKKIKIWISNYIEVPATIGFIKPVILIPFASINHLTVHQLEAIILHELSHIKRNDYLVNLLVSIIETILFFNPFIAYFIKIVKRERENCCDDFVLQYRYDPHSYASALLRLEQFRYNNVQLSLGAVSGKKQLLTRIKRITGTNRVTQFNYGQKLFALILTTAIICSIAWLSPSDIKKAVRIFSEKKNADTFQNKSHSEVIPKIKLTQTDPDNAGISKTDEQKKDSQEEINNIDNTEISKIPQINSTLEDEKEMIFDKNSPDDSLSINQAQIAESDKITPKIKLENFSLNMDEEIEKGLKQAYKEINKINWPKIQQDISKSFSKLKIDQLSEKQKSAIMEAKKYVSLLYLDKLDKQEFNATKVLKKIQLQQNAITDSIRAAASRNSLIIKQESVKVAEQYRKTELQNLNNSAGNFVFTYNTATDRNKLQRNNKTVTDSKEHLFELNGDQFKINIQTTPSQNEKLPPLSKKVKKARHIIIEI